MKGKRRLNICNNVSTIRQECKQKIWREKKEEKMNYN